jgi:hypothetical protein
LLATCFKDREHLYSSCSIPDRRICVRTGFFQSFLLMISGITAEYRTEPALTGVLMTAGALPVKKRSSANPGHRGCKPVLFQGSDQ